MINGIRSSLTYCLVIISIACLIPLNVRAESTTQLFYDSPTYLTYISNANNPITLNWKYFDIADPNPVYVQMIIWWDEYNTQECFSYVTASGDPGIDTQETVNLAGHTDISEIDIVLSYSSSVDGNGCLDSSPIYLNLFYGNPNGGLYLIGVPSSSSSTVSTSTTIIEQPSQVFFNGFVIFLMFCSWIIWIFRPKSN